jgi:hypothetical protein
MVWVSVTRRDVYMEDKMSTNNTTIRLNDGREICLSYGVPVAAFIPGLGYVKTARKYSVTTSRHANTYAGDRAKVIEDSEFCKLIEPIETRR